jgi:hypothetical protein
MKLDNIIEKMRQYFVSKEVFELRLSPLEKGFYGTVSLILLTVLGGILAVVIRK